MVNFILNWAKGVIIAVIIATIIEMLLPNGNCKKYIKVVIGIYILFNIITPIINKFNNNSITLESVIDIKKYQNELETYEVSAQKIENNNNSNIKNIYITNLKKNIKSKLEAKGYIVNDVNISINNDEEYTIKSISLKISKDETNKEEKNEIANTIINKIEMVNITVKAENNVIEQEEGINIENSQKEELKEYLSSIYEVNKSKITIN